MKEELSAFESGKRKPIWERTPEERRACEEHELQRIRDWNAKQESRDYRSDPTLADNVHRPEAPR